MAYNSKICMVFALTVVEQSSLDVVVVMTCHSSAWIWMKLKMWKLDYMHGHHTMSILDLFLYD